jgi:hypothetical protein
MEQSDTARVLRDDHKCRTDHRELHTQAGTDPLRQAGLSCTEIADQGE